MLKKYISKFTIEILPSVFATVVGAYIVNYYIVPKARGDRPPAVVTAPEAKASDGQAAATDVKPPEASAAPEPVRKISLDKPDAAKSADLKTPDAKPVDSRRHTAREKAVAKAEGKPEPAVTALSPTPVVATTSGSASAIDERRDANDLARAAIERLSRGDKVQESRAQEPLRIPDRTASAQPVPAPVQQPVQQAQPMQQLPPPIVVATPSVDNPEQRADLPRRPRPPSDIPVPLAVEMQANADRGGRTNVAEDVLSAAKSMFDKVIPKPFER